ncbi:hypothetical protein HGM15179_018175 [Zosterops borbonicus]|uniref:Integrase-type domain-containing protein n=1 Tax=Zosterops borbonicus TaxID=364589 RepID=A0A8K1FZK8_9PASS|nr:hypothetical protein HGM15179_018175 [Zosterops borbonicus]
MIHHHVVKEGRPQAIPGLYVYYKDMRMGEWQGPSQVLFNGRGYMCVSTKAGPVWVPSRFTRAYPPEEYHQTVKTIKRTIKRTMIYLEHHQTILNLLNLIKISFRVCEFSSLYNYLTEVILRVVVGQRPSKASGFALWRERHMGVLMDLAESAGPSCPAASSGLLNSAAFVHYSLQTKQVVLVSQNTFNIDHSL